MLIIMWACVCNLFSDDLYHPIGVIFGFTTTEYSVTEGQGLLAVSVLKLTEASQAASVRFSTRDVLVGKSLQAIIDQNTPIAVLLHSLKVF